MIERRHINQVRPRVWVGPHLRDLTDVEVLASAGIDAVLSLQTDEDLQWHDVDDEQIEKALRRNGIPRRRTPIRDFDEDDLVRKLPDAVAVLRQFVAAGHDTYVHCTAGVGRSPAVVLGYLIDQGWAVDEGLALLVGRHPVSDPDVGAVKRALGL